MYITGKGIVCIMLHYTARVGFGCTVVVEREMSVFLDDHAPPDTSMRLSDYVLQTFIVNIFS